MASLKDLLEKTMLFTAARGGLRDPYKDPILRPPANPVTFAEPPSDENADAEKRRIWALKHDAGTPAKITDVTALVQEHGHSMKVFDRLEVEKVSVTLKGGSAVDLPLTPAFCVLKFVLDGGRIEDSKKGWWHLESNVDVSLLLVFVYELAGGSPKPVKLELVSKLDDKFFPAPDVPADDPDAPEKPAREPPKTSGSVEVGQELKAFVAPPWVVVAVNFTGCKERADFEPAGVLGAGRFYPHVMVSCNRELAESEVKIALERPAKVMAHSEESMTDIHPLFVTDTNSQRSGSPMPFAVWSNFFDYYDVTPAIGAELMFVDPKRSGERTVKGGILRESKIRMLGGLYQPESEFPKSPGQGAFDSIHLAPRMKFKNAETGTTITDIPMAPFCEHDCLHTHMRWGDAAFVIPAGKHLYGFVGRKPYQQLKAPLVPADQEVNITPQTDSRLGYRAVQRGKFMPGAWSVFNHHGSAYSLSIASAAIFYASRFSVMTLANLHAEPYTRPLVDFIVIDQARYITDVHPQKSVAALYQRLRFTGTPDPDVWQPRIKILDLDLCRRT